MADRIQTFRSAVLVRQWDDSTQTYTEYDTAGNQTLTRAYTADEITAMNARTVAANLPALMAKAQQAISANVAYLAIASPTNAQVVAQVASLTRQVDALIKVVLNPTADQSGT